LSYKGSSKDRRKFGGRSIGERGCNTYRKRIIEALAMGLDEVF